MNRFLHYFNLAGVLALTALCVAQWQANRRLNLETASLEKAITAETHPLLVCVRKINLFFKDKFLFFLLVAEERPYETERVFGSQHRFFQQRNKRAGHTECRMRSDCEVQVRTALADNHADKFF